MTTSISPFLQQSAKLGTGNDGVACWLLRAELSGGKWADASLGYCYADVDWADC